MNKKDCFELGYITKTHGIKGEVSVYLDVDEPLEYADLEGVWIEVKKVLTPFIIDRVNVLPNKKNTALVKFQGIDSIEQAQTLLKTTLYLPLTELPSLNDKQFYYHEIIGFEAVDERYGALGKIANVYDFTQNTLLAITHQGKEVLVPINDQTIVRVSREEEKLLLNIPDGLLEIYL